MYQKLFGKFDDALLSTLDKLACRWIDFRQDQNVSRMKQDHPELAGDMSLHKLEVSSKEFEIVASHPAIFLMADEAAALLDAFHATNYVEFDMMPRIDRGKNPIRVTIQWANGEGPAQKAARLERELTKLRSQSDRLKGLWWTSDNGIEIWYPDGDLCSEIHDNLGLGISAREVAEAFCGVSEWIKPKE